MGKSNRLFGEFPPVTKQQWAEIIQKDLKGAPYKKLISKTPEGIDIKPYYHSDDMQGLDYLDTLPGNFPYTRSGKIQLNEWEIRQDIHVEDISVANKKAIHALHWGATALGFILPDEKERTRNDFDNLLKGIYFECIHINFVTTSQSASIVNYLQQAVMEKNIPGERIIGSTGNDILGFLSTNGYLHGNYEKSIDDLATLVKGSASIFPFLKTLPIHAYHTHNAGGSAVQELGIALALVSEYTDKLTAKGLNIDEIAPYFQLNFASGPSYFMEIAKYRAARLLFANLVKAWEPKSENSLRTYIHCTTSAWNQTVYDPYVNMLRGTTESMSSVLGGIDSLTVLPFDTAFRKTTKFSERIARNIQIILKEEAHLNKVVDPAGGSYYIENLTNTLAEEAWKVFLHIEDNGGFYEALKKGTIQQMLKETARQRDMNIAVRREILLGTNQYPNNQETIHEDFNHSIAFPEASGSHAKEMEPIETYRGSMAFEKLRLKTEKAQKKPVVFLLTYGNLAMRKARAGFASGFFACAGYEIIDNAGFETVEEGLEFAAQADADIIVFCSSDEEYPAMASAATQPGKRIIVIAGYPQDSLEELKGMGIKHFIHLKSNVLEELKEFHRALGID